MHPFNFLAMTCDETPDLGENSQVQSYTWSNAKLFQTMINFTCPVGMHELLLI